MKKCVYIFLSLVLCLSVVGGAMVTPAPANAQDEVVTFPDPNLEAAIREAIGKPTGDIYESDLEGLNALNADERGISDLTGLEYCISLTNLHVNWNQINDISPLANLTSLTNLCLGSNQISDISPLANLTGLTWLGFQCNQISDITSLANHTSLTTLYFDANQISDISPLANLINLTDLSLSSNQISDISPLANLTSLTRLILYINQIRNISPLANLINLTELGLQSNRIIDIQPLVDNAGLGEGDSVHLEGNPLSALSIDTYIPQLQGRGVTVYYNLTGTISGTVIDSTTSQPIPNIRVTAQILPTRIHTTTDIDGNYTLVVPTGTYNVKTCGICSGLNYVDEYYDNRYFFVLATPVEVTASGNVPNINFSLEPGAVISGNVIDEATSEPIPNVIINAYKYLAVEFIASATTDASGNYAMVVPTGSYRVETSAGLFTGMNYVDKYYDDHYARPDADPVVVTTPDPVPNIDFSLEIGGTISGTVIDSATSQPINLINVFATDYETDKYITSAFTAPNGNYTIRLPAGTYRVKTFAFIMGLNYVDEFYNNTINWNEAASVSVTVPYNTPGIDFSLEAGGTISGHMYEADNMTAVSGAVVQLYIYDGDDWILAYNWLVPTPLDGSYQHSGLMPGDYKVKFFKDGYVEEWYQEKTSLEMADIVTITAGGITANIDFTLRQLYETPPGEDVQVNDPYNGVIIEFDSVVEGGNTSVVVTDEELAPTSGFSFLGKYYDITTQATYSDNIIITITYDDTGMTLEEEGALRLYHWNGSAWEDVTVLPVDTTNNLISGVVTSLSWFVVGTPPQVTWLPPLTTEPEYTVQAGRTIPIKFDLTDTNGNLVTEVNVIVTVIRDSDGFIALSEPASRRGNHFQVNVKTKDWELGEYTIQLSINQDAKYDLILIH